jgi:hypothetical protein
MARYSLSFHAITPTATADTTNLVDSTYPFLLQGGNSTQRLNISEIYMGGEAASTSSPTLMKLARDSTVGALWLFSVTSRRPSRSVRQPCTCWPCRSMPTVASCVGWLGLVKSSVSWAIRLRLVKSRCLRSLAARRVLSPVTVCTK